MNNKFIKAIAGSAEGIKLQRAVNVATAALLAQEALINDLRKEVQAVQAALTGHLDIGPDSVDSLRPVGPNFDATEWVASIQGYKLALARAQERLDIALATQAEWFNETPAA